MSQGPKAGGKINTKHYFILKLDNANLSTSAHPVSPLSVDNMAGSPASPTLPKRIPDLPVSIVLAVTYFICATFMIRRLLQSQKKFRIGILLIGFCMSRMVTFSLRAAWSTHVDNHNLQIAATVFVAAGVIAAVALNMQLVFRLAKSLRPSLQTSAVYRRATTAVQLFIIVVLAMTIAPAIISLLTTDASVKRKTQYPLKISTIYIAVYTCLPFFLAPTLYFALPRGPIVIAKRVWVRVLLIMWISLCLGVELTTKAVNVFEPARLHSWYGTRWGFYVFTPMLELLVIIPIILIDLCHLFGDSNASVLNAINGISHQDEEEKPSDQQAMIEAALAQTTSNYIAGRWSDTSAISHHTYFNESIRSAKASV